MEGFFYGLIFVVFYVLPINTFIFTLVRKRIAYIIVSILLISGGNLSFGSSIDKGYEALSTFDYFNAKKHFSKALKRDVSAASQGLAIIYYRNDNPFHNIDSALLYINKSVLNWKFTTEKKILKWTSYGFSEDNILSLRQLISTEFFMLANREHTIPSFSQFIDNHSWAYEIPRATVLRDSIAFYDASKTNTAESYTLFLDTYVGSSYTELAQKKYYKLQYTEETHERNIESYDEFISSNPASPHKIDAEVNIYELVTESNTSQSFVKFLDSYPESSLQDTVWTLYYQKYISNYSKDRINEFLVEYPSTSNKESVETDLELCDLIYFPYVENGVYGFMNSFSKSLIQPEYETVSFFNEGLSIVSNTSKFGVINKQNKRLVPLFFDGISSYEKGVALVENRGKVGLIDRNGRFVLDCIYNDIGAFSEGLVYADLGGQFGYYSTEGVLMIPHLFDDVYDFIDGRARVEVAGKIGVINRKGDFLVPLIYKELEHYYNDLYVFGVDGYYGIMNERSHVLVPPVYSRIGNVSNGLALVSKDDQLFYFDTLGHLKLDDSYTRFPNDFLKGEFNESVANIVKDDKYGRINPDGEELSKFKYQNIGVGVKFYPAQLEEQWGLYNQWNILIIPHEYQSLFVVDDKYVIAQQNDSTGVLDIKGNILVPPTFNNVSVLKDNYFLIGENEKVGLYHNRTMIIPVEYDKIGVFNEDFVFLSKEGELFYYNLKDEKIILFDSHD